MLTWVHCHSVYLNDCFFNVIIFCLMVHILYSTILDEILISPSKNCYLVVMEGCNNDTRSCVVLGSLPLVGHHWPPMVGDTLGQRLSLWSFQLTCGHMYCTLGWREGQNWGSAGIIWLKSQSEWSSTHSSEFWPYFRGGGEYGIWVSLVPWCCCSRGCCAEPWLQSYWLWRHLPNLVLDTRGEKCRQAEKESYKVWLAGGWLKQPTSPSLPSGAQLVPLCVNSCELWQRLEYS